MADGGEVWDRIAAALDPARAAAAPPPTDWLAHPAYIWEGEQARGVAVLDALPLAQLRGIDAQKVARCATNCARLASGAAAHDVLLWGARGMGKSALVRAAVARCASGKPQGARAGAARPRHPCRAFPH